VFGNLGWRRPIGAAGLVRFSRQGDRLWAYDPPSGASAIADCYALNVDARVTWIYYYTDFPDGSSQNCETGRSVKPVPVSRRQGPPVEEGTAGGRQSTFMEIILRRPTVARVTSVNYVPAGAWRSCAGRFIPSRRRSQPRGQPPPQRHDHGDRAHGRLRRGLALWLRCGARRGWPDSELATRSCPLAHPGASGSSRMLAAGGACLAVASCAVRRQH
jgi:hypothetical protein